jgi:hypothetical protein
VGNTANLRCGKMIVIFAITVLIKRTVMEIVGFAVEMTYP